MKKGKKGKESIVQYVLVRTVQYILSIYLSIYLSAVLSVCL